MSGAHSANRMALLSCVAVSGAAVGRLGRCRCSFLVRVVAIAYAHTSILMQFSMKVGSLSETVNATAA